MAGTLTPVLHLVTCGSVDDGKSTLIGRLLAETNSVPIDTLEYARRTRRGGSTIPVGEIDYSLLTDGLEAEREQGITIDVAYRHMNLPNGRRVLVADSPGHEQYTRNMAVAASNGDVAVLMVDAARGVRPQTHRHLTICALMGVKTVIVAVNKMDLVGYEHATFEEVTGIVRTTAARLDVPEVISIPVSAVTGDNITMRADNMPWYHGPTLLEALEVWEPLEGRAGAEVVAKPFRFPVQFIVRAEGNFRGYAGTVVSGSVARGDKVLIADSGRTANVDRIVTYDLHVDGHIADLDRADTGAGRDHHARPRGRRHPRRRHRRGDRRPAAAGRPLRRRHGLARRGAAGPRSVVPARLRLAVGARHRHQRPAPARRRRRA